MRSRRKNAALVDNVVVEGAHQEEETLCFRVSTLLLLERTALHGTDMKSQ